MLVTLTKRVPEDHSGPAPKITVHAYNIESIDNITAPSGCTLNVRSSGGEKITFVCAETHEEAVLAWEKSLEPKPILCCSKKKSDKKKSTEKTTAAAKATVKKKKVAKKKVAKKKK